MRYFFPLSLLLMAIFSLMSCHTIPPKTYHYIAPHGKADRKCIGRCLFARKNCLRICELKNSLNCDCTTSFNTCYSACGGEVIEQQGK